MPKAKAPAKKTDSKEVAKKKGRRYKPWEREKIMAKFAKLREKGVPAVEAGKKVGVPYITLQAWAKKDGKPLPGSRKAKKGAKAKMAGKGRGPGRPPKAMGRKPGRPKGKVAAKSRGRPRGRPRAERPAPAGGLVLVTPSGNRLEGIQISDLLRVLRQVK